MPYGSRKPIRPKPADVSIETNHIREQPPRTGKHGGACPSTSTQCVHALQGGEAVVGIDTRLASLVEFISKDVQHKLAIALRVDVPVGLVVETLSQRRCVDEVAIVRHADSIRAVHIERLCLCVGAATSSGVS
jgi:hypothetical protein